MSVIGGVFVGFVKGILQKFVLGKDLKLVPQILFVFADLQRINFILLQDLVLDFRIQFVGVSARETV